MADGSDRYAGLGPPHPFRRHQGEALAALDAAWAAGRDRAWVVLPPGAGKTLVGLETIRRAGLPAVVLSPNTAIQGQWVAGWRSLHGHTGPDTAIATDRDLDAPVTALTYQALAVFADPPDRDDPADHDDPADRDGPADPGGAEDPAPTELGRLHPHGRALVARLQELGPLTLVLDECHHLLESWGRLLAEVLDLLPQARVLGLTATPPTTLSTEQADLVGELFGEVVHATSVPAVVREGDLAPFTDLVWLVEPTALEQEWLDGQRERFAELTTALSDPAYGSTPFLTWVDQRFAGEVPFARVARQHPALADAALRLAHVGLLQLRQDDPAAQAAAGERHRRAPDDEDWALLVDDWHDRCLALSGDPADEEVRGGLRRALPSVGWALTRSGVRRGRSPVDRVLARSAAKSRALVEIVSAEHRVLGDRLAMLVICDHEAATATVPADLAGVVGTRAGSARLALADLLADPGTAALDPVLVTGRTVAGARSTMVRLRDRVAVEHPHVSLVVSDADADGIYELTGPAGGSTGWSSRTWVRSVTAMLADGEARVLVGTRALLGEGWDAPRVTGLVDLSTATTVGSVVQTRGRTLRLDPADPDKVAVNWTVCAVATDHPRGDSDWNRTVRKHEGYFGVDAAGDVVDGVAHVHPSFSPFAPPDPATFDATNAAMLVRAEQRADVARAWSVGTAYDDRVRTAAWVRPGRASSVPVLARTAPVEPRPLVLTADGIRGATAWPVVPGHAARDRRAVAAVLLAAAGCGVVLGHPWWAAVAVALAVLAAAASVAAARSQRREVLATRRDLLEEALQPPDLVGMAAAVADGLHLNGLIRAGAAALTWHPDPDGRVRIELAGTGPTARDDSTVFAEALAELLAPIGAPRYLVPRPVLTSPPDDRALGELPRPADVRPDGQAWHPVPTVLGTRAARAACFARAWDRWVGGGPALHTGSPEGAGVLAAVRGADPLAQDTVLRLSWH